MKNCALSVVLMCTLSATLSAQGAAAKDTGAQQFLGYLGANPHVPHSTANPASRYDPDSVINPHGRYGNRTSPQSANNPFATETPTLEDSAGRSRGKLSANPFDADSISNPYGRYGSPYSPDSINNPYGAGNPFTQDSPHNRHGRGLRIIAPQ